jgi:hypothetical protein
MSELESFCSAQQQQVIVDSLNKGDRLLADVTHEHCLNKIRDENADLKRYNPLVRQGFSTGLSSEEMDERDLKQKSGKSQVLDLDLELLQAIKSKEKVDGICTLDFDAHGNPYAVDTAITCKGDK